MTDNPTTEVVVCDDHGMELPPRIAEIARKWLVYQHGLTDDEAAKVMIRAKGHSGPTRQRQRAEAIDVADFVETLHV